MNKEIIDFLNTYPQYTNDMIGALFGVTPTAVSMWRNGTRQMSLSTKKLFRLFIKYPAFIEEFKKV